MSAFSGKFPDGLQTLGLHAGIILVGLALIGTLWHWDDQRRTISERPRRKLEPIHVIALGLLIAFGGVVWHIYRSPMVQRRPGPAAAPVANASQAEARTDRPVLLHSYADDEDRRQIRSHLRLVSSLLTDEIAPTQIAIHSLLDAIVRTNGGVAVGQLTDACTKLAAARTMLTDKFPNGRRHSNEVWDALGGNNVDRLFAVMDAARTYVQDVKVLQTSEDAEGRQALIQRLRPQLQEANGKLSEWVRAAINGIERKQKALEKWDVAAPQ